MPDYIGDIREVQDIIIHGRRCPNWQEPLTHEAWLELQLVKLSSDAEGEAENWECPACGAVVFTVYDHGEIDLGV